MASFTGQLKKRPSDAFDIPLLCDFAVFRHAFAVLQAAQRHQVLETEECNAKYARPLGNGMPMYFPFAQHPHQLRSVYAAFVHKLYDCEHTFNGTAKRILGHASLDVSLAYTSVHLEGAPDAPTFGALP